jgi:hypothetical protein
VHRIKSSRLGLLAAATALIAVLVAAPGAGAATFEGGPWKFDFKTFTKAKKLKLTTTGASPKTSTGGTFELGTGQITNNEQASGNISVGSSTSVVQFALGKKKVTLTSITQKLTAGKGQINAVINKKGKAVTLFDVASQGKIGPNSTFTELRLTSSSVALTKSGASALNKAFGFKGTAVVKAKQKVGTVGFTGERSLTVLSGTSTTYYDKAFGDALKNCDITLSAVQPASAIAADANNPYGGVNLPVNGANGGTLDAETLTGQVNHEGGTSLDRPGPGQPGNSTGKAEYHSPLINFVFGFSPGAYSLTAFVTNSNNNLPIGTVTGTLEKNLTAEAGTVTLSNGALNLSDAASGTLSQNQPPLGADCPIPAGSKIGSLNSSINVG